MAALGLWAAALGGGVLVRSVAGLVTDRTSPTLRRLWLEGAVLAVLAVAVGSTLAWLAMGAL
jgi:hypothetical protein